MADEQDLIVRFIGLDLLSNVANDIGYGVNRLAGRINSLSSIANAQWRAMERSSLALQSRVTASNEVMALTEGAMAQGVINASARVAAARNDLDTLEAQVANRRSLRATRQLNAAKEVANAEQTLASTEAGSAARSVASIELVAARQARASVISRNALLNQRDARRIVVAEQEVNAAKQIETSQRTAAAEVDTQNAMTRAHNAGALERQRIARQEEEMRIASTQRMQQAITSAGAITVMSGAVMVASAAAIGGALFYAADHASNFEKQLLLLQTQAGATKADVNLMRTAILQLSPQFGFTAEQAATAAFHIESVGLRGAAAVDALKVSMMGARVGAADLEDTTNLLAVLLASGIVPAGTSAIGVMATLNAIIGQGNIRMEELTTSFRTGLIGAMQVAGVSLRDTGAALATLTDLGFSAATAGTSLRSALTMIAAPTNKAAQLLKDLGFSAEEVSSAHNQMVNALLKAGVNVTQFAETVRTQGIEAGLQLLHDKMQEAGLTADEMSATLTKAFGGSRIGAAFKVLFENMARLDMREKAIAKAGNAAAFEAAWAATSDLTATKLAQLESTFNNIVIVLGEALMPTVNRLIDSLVVFLQPIGDWITDNQQLISQFAPMLVALLAIGGAVLILVGGLGILGTMFSALISGIGAFAGGLGVIALIGGGILAGFTAAVVLLRQSWLWMSTLWESRVIPAAQRIWNTLRAVWAAISNGIAEVRPQFDAAFTDFATTLTENGGLWDNATMAFQNFSKSLLTFVKSDVFASLVADLSVSLPQALKISLDAAILFADALQLAFTTAATAAQVSLDLLNRDYAKATADAITGQAEIDRLNSRFQADQITAAIDYANQYSAENQRMWQKIHDDTMKATASLGDDGSAAYSAAVSRLIAAGNTRAIRDEIYNGAYANGQSVGDGLIAGVNSKAGQVIATVDNLAAAVYNGMQAGLVAFSPSRIFAKLGESIPQGAALGVERGAPELMVAVERMTSQATQVQPAMTLPVSGGGSSSALLQVMQEIRDGIFQVAAYVDPSNQPATERAPQQPSSRPQMSDPLAVLYQLLQQTENNRRRGVVAYGT